MIDYFELTNDHITIFDWSTNLAVECDYLEITEMGMLAICVSPS